MENEEFINEVRKVSEVRHSDRTVETYINRLRSFSKYYVNKNLNDITATDINDYLRYIKKTRKNKAASIKSARDVLNFVYNIHLEKNLSIDSFSAKWKERKVVSAPSQSELFAIFDLIENKDLKTSIEFIYGTGVDNTEMLRVKVKDIDFDHDLVKITLNRNKGTRKAVLPKKLKTVLLGSCEHKRVNDYVFVNKFGEPFHTTTVLKAFRKAVDKFDSKLSYTTRSLRYSYIKHMEYSQVPLLNIIKYLKLSETSSMDYYTRIDVIKSEIDFSPLDLKIIDNAELKNEPYISLNRIVELGSIKSANFDFKILCQFLTELNSAYGHNQILSIPMIIRSIINHVPPIFNCSNFTEVSNNYSGSGASFKNSMKHLDLQLKNVADKYLHQHIRKKEELPEPQQVDFRSPLDLLLQEIITITR